MTKERTSKIVKYALEEDCAYLRKMGLSYKQIAEELNNSGKVPENDSISPAIVAGFLNKTLPAVSKELVSESRDRILQVVNTQFDVIQEVGLLYARTRKLLEQMEDDAELRKKMVNPYQFKAVSSEMREMLNTMLEIQREVNDYENIRRFMEIVLQTLAEEVPDKIPIIVEKLRVTKGTAWFASILDKER